MCFQNSRRFVMRRRDTCPLMLSPWWWSTSCCLVAKVLAVKRPVDRVEIYIIYIWRDDTPFQSPGKQIHSLPCPVCLWTALRARALGWKLVPTVGILEEKTAANMIDEVSKLSLNDHHWQVANLNSSQLPDPCTSGVPKRKVAKFKCWQLLSTATSDGVLNVTSHHS